MLLSALAAVGLGVVLGIIFIPILLAQEAQMPAPRYNLAVVPGESELQFVIVGASNPRALGEFQGFLQIDGENHTFGPLPVGIAGVVSFEDRNEDGLLNQGDLFRVAYEEGRNYVLLILYPALSQEGGVGRAAWPSP